MLAFINKNFFGLVILILFLFFMFSNTFSGCRQRMSEGTLFKPDTASTTVYQPQPQVILVPQTPVQTGSVQPVIIPPQYQTGIPAATYDELVRQFKEQGIRLEDLANKFLTLNKSADSIQLKDSSGNRIGVVQSNYEVQENLLKSAQHSYQLNLPHTYTTITQPYKPKAQMYWGLGVEGNQYDFFNGGKLKLAFKSKQDQLYGLGAGFLYQNGQAKPQFELQYLRKF